MCLPRDFWRQVIENTNIIIAWSCEVGGLWRQGHCDHSKDSNLGNHIVLKKFFYLFAPTGLMILYRILIKMAFFSSALLESPARQVLTLVSGSKILVARLAEARLITLLECCVPNSGISSSLYCTAVKLVSLNYLCLGTIAACNVQPWVPQTVTSVCLLTIRH